jgi:DNA-binding NarL/FixJ family response regulator
VRVIIADDHVLLREGLARLLAEGGLEVNGQAGDAEELLQLVRQNPPNIVITDIRMPPTHSTEGIEAAQAIKREFPEVGVLVLSEYLESHYAMSLVSEVPEGVGYLLKQRVTDIDQLCEAVRRVGQGEFVIDPSVVGQLVERRRPADSPVDTLSPREKEVLSLIAEGRSNQAISERLFLTAKTVEAHVRSIFNKLALSPTTDDHRRVLAVLAYLRS